MWEIFDRTLHYPLISFGNTQVTLLTVIDFLIVVLLAVVIAMTTQWFLKKRVFKIARFDAGFQYMVSRIVGYIVFLLGFFIGLQTLGIDLTSFTVLAGAIGVGIGFGLQNVVNNFVCGLIILSERTLQIGDRVEITGFRGFIQKIGARSSVLHTTDNLLIIVPNSELVSKPVTRWGRDEQYPYRLEVKVGVSYESDLRLVRQILLEVANAHPSVMKIPAPFAGIAEFAESCVIFKLFFSTVIMMNKEMDLQTDIYISIQKAFRERCIEMPFPQYDLYLRNPVKLEMQGSSQ